MKSLIPLEYEEQCNVVEYLDLLLSQGKVTVFSAVPNNLYTKSWGLKLKQKKQGVRSGVPDLIILINDTVLFLEMKRVSGGKIGDEQKIWLESLQGKKVEARVAKGFLEAKRIIDSLLIKKVV